MYCKLWHMHGRHAAFVIVMAVSGDAAFCFGSVKGTFVAITMHGFHVFSRPTGQHLCYGPVAMGFLV